VTGELTITRSKELLHESEPRTTHKGSPTFDVEGFDPECTVAEKLWY